jgi:hypothetical protein
VLSTVAGAISPTREPRSWPWKSSTRSMPAGSPACVPWGPMARADRADRQKTLTATSQWRCWCWTSIAKSYTTARRSPCYATSTGTRFRRKARRVLSQQIQRLPLPFGFSPPPGLGSLRHRVLTADDVVSHERSRIGGLGHAGQCGLAACSRVQRGDPASGKAAWSYVRVQAVSNSITGRLGGR